MTEDQIPKLDEATFIFTQEANCLNNGIEQIEIKCRADLGIDVMGSCFYEINTTGWSVDSADEFKALFDRIHQSVFPKQIKKHK